MDEGPEVLFRNAEQHGNRIALVRDRSRRYLEGAMPAAMPSLENDDVPTRRRVVVVSFFVDLLDVVTNLVVAILTGSAVVFGEMAQGLADSIGSGLLIVGDRRANRPEDAEHPHGYEREAFFWALLSAVAMLLIGAGLSAWRGYEQLVDPSPIEKSYLAIGVLIFAIGTNGYAVGLSLKNLVSDDSGLRAAMENANKPLVKSALLRDVIGTTTSIIGLCALILYQVFDAVVFDSIGTLAAAVMMAAASFVLMAQARELITGRSLPPDDLDQLRQAILATPGVEGLNELAAVHAGAERVRVDVDLDLAEGLDTVQIEELLDEVEARARAAVPEIASVHVALNSP